MMWTIIVLVQNATSSLSFNKDNTTAQLFRAPMKMIIDQIRRILLLLSKKRIKILP